MAAPRVACELDAVERARRALDSALAQVNETVAQIAQASELPGAEFQLKDADVLALLESRERIWRMRQLATLTPQVPDSGSEAEREFWWLKWPLYLDCSQAPMHSFINRDDEAAFKANLTPSLGKPLGKLGFDVDFYGRGYFPPGAYHSEGHQDSMGLCLYRGMDSKCRGPHQSKK